MKKSMQAGIVLIALLAAAATAAADAKDAADTRISLGLGLWSSTWKETVNAKSGGKRDFDNGAALLVGPTVSAKFPKNWFAEFSYLRALGDYESPNWFTQGDSMKFRERTDTDLLGGYVFRDPYNDLSLGVFATYKTINAPASYTNAKAGINGADVGTWKTRGPGVGLRVEQRFGQSTLLYGNLAYLWMEQEFSFSSGSVSRFGSDGWLLDVTVEQVFAVRLSAAVGVKFQQFKGQTANGDNVTDFFSGLTGGIKYTF